MLQKDRIRTALPLPSDWASVLWNGNSIDEILDSLATNKGTSNFPPHNVILSKDKLHAKIEVAVAGYSKDGLNVSVENDLLRVSAKGTQVDIGEDWEYAKRGLARRDFTLTWELKRQWDIKKVSYAHGVLTIDLDRPEAMKPRTIQIEG